MSARCASHPDVDAAVACGRCGRFLCEACVARPVPDLPPTGILCHACAAVLGAPPSRRASWAFGLSLFALGGTLVFPCVPILAVVLWPAAVFAGPIALALALGELAAVRRGEAPSRGERTARSARNIALAQLVLVVALVVLAFALRGMNLVRVD